MKINKLILENLLTNNSNISELKNEKIIINLIENTKNYKNKYSKIELLFKELGPLTSLNYNLYIYLINKINKKLTLEELNLILSHLYYLKLIT